MPLEVGVVEWTDELEPDGEHWRELAAGLSSADIDLLVTNELPFGGWLARSPVFSERDADRSIELARRGIARIGELGISTVLTSVPVRAGAMLANEAVTVATGQVTPIHRKQRFPQEAGWFERTWFEPGSDEYPLFEASSIRVGTLLCTEAMFTELARSYGRRGAHLIAIPRASSSSRIWRTAARMAAIVSGCYVVSSNRTTASPGDGTFGGDGFAYAPDGELIGCTSPEQPLLVVRVDPTAVEIQQTRYPCYIG